MRPGGKSAACPALVAGSAPVAASTGERFGLVGDMLGAPEVETVPMLLPPAEPTEELALAPLLAPALALLLLELEEAPDELLPAELPELPLPPPAPPPWACRATDVARAVRVRKSFEFMGGWVEFRGKRGALGHPRRARCPPRRQTVAKDVCAGWGICLSGALLRA